MKHIDFWRLMGVVWGMAIAADLLWSLTYPLYAVSVEAFIVKDIILTALITFVFLNWYYQKAPEGPSLINGAKLGLIIFGITFGATLASAFGAAVVGLPPLLLPMGDLPEWYVPFQVVLSGVMVASAAATGWYLEKHGK